MTSRQLSFMLVTVCFLNIADYLFTLRALSYGALEANPLMNPIIAEFPGFIVKVILAPLGLLFIWHTRQKWNRAKPLIIAGVYTLFIAYSAVTIWHIYGQTLLTLAQ